MKRLLLILMLACAGPALAVEPGEMLADPAQEARARELSQGLRCPVCRNESIDESNADLAKELRIVLRERIEAGDSDAQAVNYLVARYGEYILLRPDASGVNLLLWIAAPLMLAAALGVGWATIRRRRSATAPDPLSAEEEEELARLLKE